MILRSPLQCSDRRTASIATAVLTATIDRVESENMATLDSRNRSKEARDAYRKVRTQRHLTRAAKLDDPLPTATFAAILDPVDGLLNGPLIKLNGLDTVIPIWSNTGSTPGDTQDLELFIAPGHVTDPQDPSFVRVLSQQFVYPFADTWTGDFNIPLNHLQPDGAFTFKHEVIQYTGQVSTSALVNLTSDTTAPNERSATPEPGAMVFNTSELDDSNIGSVTGVIPDYLDKAAGDSVVYWYAKDPLPDDPTTLPPVEAAREVPANNQITIPQAYIETRQDGIFYVLYTLFDRALNRSRLSGYKRFTVTLGALPNVVAKPEVPVGANGAVIDLETAAGGVFVEIPTYTGWKSGDMIRATWGGLDLPAVIALENTVTEIPVPAQTLRTAYVGATGQKTTTVSYVVDRQGRVFGPQQDDFLVDFSVIGPPLPDPDPDFPDPTNPVLLAGVVKGGGGDNLLDITDANKPADFEFTIYDPVNAGETLEFWWENTRVMEATFTITTETPGSTKTIQIPWDYILATDNGPGKQVYYTIGDPTVTPNRQKSQVTLVDVVDAIVIEPNPATFPHITSRGWLVCSSLQAPDNAIVVSVPDLSAWLAPGDTVEMSWRLFQDRTGTTEITSAALIDTVTLGDASSPFPVTGFNWRVQPYVTHIAPAYNPPDHPEANTVVTYSFTYKGKRVTSLPAPAPVGMFMGSGGCIIP